MVGRTKTAAKSSDPDYSAPSRSRETRRSPARTKSPARKSPSRTKPKTPEQAKVSPIRRRSPARKSPARHSPARSPARTPPRSPSRRSPIRRSPGRSSRAEKIELPSQLERESIARRKLEVDLDSDSAEFEPVQEVKEKPKAAVRGRTRKTDSDVEDPKVELKNDSASVDEVGYGLTKRITRYSHAREVERVVHLKHFDSASTKKVGEFSDEDDSAALKKPEFELSLDKKQTEFGGSLGAVVLMLLSPLSIVSLYVMCDEKQCSFIKYPNLAKYASFGTYFDLKSFLGCLAFSLIYAILAALPFGGRRVQGLPSKHSKFTYTTNGIFALVVILLIFGGLEFSGVRLSDYIASHLFQLLIAHIALGLLLSVYAYVRSFYVPLSALNSHTVNKPGLYSFFMGREINPRPFNVLDLKMFQIKTSTTAAVLLDIVFLLKSLGINHENITNLDFKSLNFDPSMITLVLLHAVYLIDSIASESVWLTSFEVNYEGFGYITAVGYNMYPFMTAIVTKYVYDFGVQLAYWKLGLICITFAIGYFLFRGANNQKDAFRKNPYNPALAHLETIPTTQGKKLLVSGFWGFVRHPNYLGDILMTMSFLPYVLCVPPVLTIYSIVLYLLHRTTRDNQRCQQKYGAAWERYCQRVKYILIPKVY